MPAAIVLSSRPDNLLIFAGVGFATGIYWFVKGFRLLQRKRLILNTPASKIRSASMGLVEVSGQAVSPYVITSPLKQANCYYYRSVAWQLKQQGKNSEWVKVADESLHVPFYLSDETGKVLVDPRGAEMDLHRDLQQEYHRSVLFNGPEMPGCVADFLVRHGVDPDRRIKVEEYCIKPKNFLFVLGSLSQNPGLDASVTPSWAKRVDQRRNGCSKLLPAQETAASTSDNGRQEIIRITEEAGPVAATQMTQQQKIAAALSKAGIANPKAWNAAGIEFKSVRPLPTVASIKTGSATVETEPEEANAADDSEGFDLHPPVVLMQGAYQPAFFISWQSQREVVQSLGWKSGLMIWGGPALSLGCIYFLLAHFHWL